MGEQFVTGETIARRWRPPREAQGFRYSYDMLGEAALTAADAQRYLAAYEHAIHAIGAARRPRRVDGPGISIKLSALHPRYSRAQRERVMDELCRGCWRWRCWRAATTSASTSTPRRPTGWSCRSTCWSAGASSRRWPAGTASASWSRPTRSAARR
jgi:hypothetical protein